MGDWTISPILAPLEEAPFMGGSDEQARARHVSGGNIDVTILDQPPMILEYEPKLPRRYPRFVNPATLIAFVLGAMVALGAQWAWDYFSPDEPQPPLFGSSTRVVMKGTIV